MDMLIDFPGGARVDAHFSHFTVPTDQNGAAPTPFAVFLSSIGTCAGIYVLGFCQQRGLSAEGVRILQRVHTNPMTGMVETIDLEIQVPPEFPEQYKNALIKSANLCKVKKHLEHPPVFNTYTKVVEAA
jgi:ribosomal protein S12 methylthiotransferase accessory factor